MLGNAVAYAQLPPGTRDGQELARIHALFTDTRRELYQLPSGYLT